MADILSKQYSSVFSTPKHPPPSTTDQPVQMGDIPLTRKDFEDMIDELDNTSAAGPDGFPAIFLKHCKKSLSRPLLILWRKCLDTGKTPETLKKSLIVPIHKGGNRTQPERYRPVALTSHLIKIFEKILRKHMTHFIEENDLFNANQHGFRSGRSCLSQLLSHYDEILSLLEQGKNADVVYLDFSKAFDKVDLNLALTKVQNLGIGGKILKWLQSFLTNRYQTVLVDGTPSNPTPVISGVPQGSVLGPLIFLILMGDIDEKVQHSSTRSFADDTRLIKGIEIVEDTQKLQGDLNSVYVWSDDNNMEFNAVKFELLRYGPNTEVKAETHYTSSSNTEIKEYEYVKDLGVLMSNDCKFKHHINNVVINARKTSSWILRTFRTRAATPMLTLWKSLVLPKLEYCSQLWNPWLKCDIQSLEMVQWSFIRKIIHPEKSYWSRLKAFKLYSLERRRERYMIIYTWKILENLVPNINQSDGLRPVFQPRLGRLCFVKARITGTSVALQSIRHNFLSTRGPILFNSLPKELRNLSGCPVLEFKKKLDKFLVSVPDEPSVLGATTNAASNSIKHQINNRQADIGLFT